MKLTYFLNETMFDVYCENENGEKILEEMQKGEQEYFKDRSIFYFPFPIREQAVKGAGRDYEENPQINLREAAFLHN